MASSSCCASPSSVRILERLGGLGLVDAAHCKADMDQHPVADAGFERMLPSSTMQAILTCLFTPLTSTVASILAASSILTIRPGMPRHMIAVLGYYPTIGRALSRMFAASMRRAAPIAACPSASPPSLAGTWAWRRARGSSRAQGLGRPPRTKPDSGSSRRKAQPSRTALRPHRPARRASTPWRRRFWRGPCGIASPSVGQAFRRGDRRGSPATSAAARYKAGRYRACSGWRKGRRALRSRQAGRRDRRSPRAAPLLRPRTPDGRRRG